MKQENLKLQSNTVEVNERFYDEITKSILGYVVEKDFINFSILKTNLTQELFIINGIYIKPNVTFPDLKNHDDYDIVNFKIKGNLKEQIIQYWDNDRKKRRNYVMGKEY